ncbi:histone-lysine N-methyltransferase PR-Set7 [Trichonephila clavipes]|nr:histone-lysine N-methyltransferase PR-Set7 [Trichonephila clavipes]
MGNGLYQQNPHVIDSTEGLVIFLDSKSAVEAIRNREINISCDISLLEQLHNKRKSCTLQWIPAHVNIEAGRRKAHRSKTLIESSKMSEKGSKVLQTDITKYFVQNEDSITDNLRLPEGSLPSPDDAALPCSTSLCSDLTKSLKDQKCLDSDKDLDKNETIVPEEKIQKIFNMTNKDKSDVSKKKKNNRRHGGGRVRSTTPAEDRYIVLSAKRTRRTTAQQVENQFLAASGKQISRKTVARRLRGGGLYARRPVVCVPLTRQHRTARLQWCREHHK